MHRLISARYFPYFIAGCLSILCSFWISGRELVINPDAICYLQSAATIKEGIHAAMNLCGQAKWPFYSMLIAGFVHLTHASYQFSAYFLNGIFSLLTVLVFMRITSLLIVNTSLEKHKRWLISLAAAVILLAHEFNSVKTYIIRDHGFWAFYLASILFLLYYFRTRQWSYAIAWSASILLATLFRIEGALFLLFIPFIAWFDVKQNKMARLKSFVALHSLTLLLAILGLSVFLIYHPPLTGRLYELQFQLLHGGMALQQNFQTKTLGLAQTVLGESGARDAAPVLFVTLIVWYVLNVIANLSWIYAILLIYAGYKKLLITDAMSRHVLWGYVIINVVITLVFLGQSMFLSKRYLIALSLVLMLWVPFALFALVQQWKKRKWPLILAVLFILISALGGLFNFGYSKAYIREAGQWVSQNVPANAKLYSNDLQFMYYSNHFGNQIYTQYQIYSAPNVLSHHQWKQYDYLALRVDQKELNSATSIVRRMDLTPIQIFQNKRGDQIRIYRRSS